MKFKEDLLENEKNDPHEASSLRFINVPIVLIAFFTGFGITYLALKTPNTSLSPGDSRTLSESNNKAENPAPIENDFDKLVEKGKQVYTTTCQACHQASGSGIPGAFPPLTESEWVTGSGLKVAAIILHGLQGEITVKEQKYNSIMPPFKDQLTSEEVAAVSTYIRNSFGNKADAVYVNDVELVREKTKDKVGPWNADTEFSKYDL